MWGKCKIVNVSWLLFSTLLIGQNLFTTKKHPFKVECKCILLSNRPPCRFMHSLCKNERINCYVGKAPSPHNKRNCYPSYPDHYLMRYKTHWWRELRTWSHTINLFKTSANSPTKTTNYIGNVLGQQSGLNDGLLWRKLQILHKLLLSFLLAPCKSLLVLGSHDIDPFEQSLSSVLHYIYLFWVETRWLVEIVPRLVQFNDI